MNRLTQKRDPPVAITVDLIEPRVRGCPESTPIFVSKSIFYAKKPPDLTARFVEAKIIYAL